MTGAARPMDWRDAPIDRCPGCDSWRWNRHCRRCDEQPQPTQETSMSANFSQATAAVITQAFIEHVTDVAMAKVVREFIIERGATLSPRDKAMMRAAIGVGAAQAMTEFRELVRALEPHQ